MSTVRETNSSSGAAGDTRVGDAADGEGAREDGVVTVPRLGPVDLAAKIEQQTALGEAADRLRGVAGTVVGTGPVRDALSGTGLGHPAHPALVSVPIGCWAGALMVDLTGGPRHRRMARRLVGLGVLGAAPAVASGLSDWTFTDGAEARVGLVHAAANTTALSCFAASWWARRRGGLAGLGWSLAGIAAGAVGGWLGGHLAYGMGVGVDTNAFETGPDRWTAAGTPPASEDSATQATAGGVQLLVARTGSGVHVLADRCSHRGGPLSKGEVTGECVTCPWHGSRFDLPSGAVVSGPASIPQPAYQVRLGDGGIEVRRAEPRALRRRLTRPARRR